MSAELLRANNGVANEAGASGIARLYETAVQHVQAGRHRDAQLCCRRILELDAGHVDTLQLMGLLSLQTRQYDAAIEWVGRANERDPNAGYLLSLATALEDQGLHQEAVRTLVRVARQKPNDAESWTRRGNLF